MSKGMRKGMKGKERGKRAKEKCKGKERSWIKGKQKGRV